jgi:hypothetical protein
VYGFAKDKPRNIRLSDQVGEVSQSVLTGTKRQKYSNKTKRLPFTDAQLQTYIAIEMRPKNAGKGPKVKVTFSKPNYNVLFAQHREKRH